MYFVIATGTEYGTITRGRTHLAVWVTRQEPTDYGQVPEEEYGLDRPRHEYLL